MRIKCKRYAILVLAALLLLTFVTGCKKDTSADMDDSAISTAPSVPTATVATVTSRELNLRDAPSFDGIVVTTLQKGDAVTILEWTEVDGIKWGRTQNGWICLLYTTLEEVPLTNLPENPIPTIPTTEAGSSNEGLVIVETLNIRSGPDSNKEKLGEYHWGDVIIIMDEEGGWLRTEKGWISQTYVYRQGKPDMEPLNVTVTASRLNIRNGPSTKYEEIAELVNGDKTTILKIININGKDWGYNGTGWLNMTYVKENK